MNGTQVATQNGLTADMPRQLVAVGERISEFISLSAEVESRLRRRADPLPDDTSVVVLRDAFWRIWLDLQQALDRNPDFVADRTEFERARQVVRFQLFPVLGRSRFFWRSMVSPHGYSGDYRMLEWMYDLEGSAGTDRTQPAFLNALDRIYASIDSVEAVWERRHWLRDAVVRHVESTREAVIVDIACGGARYIADALERTPARPARIILIDQDPSALYHASCALQRESDRIELRCMPLKNLAVYLTDRDSPAASLVISAGLFDYLDASTARGVINLLPDAEVLITNFHRHDRSRLAKEWGAGWDIVYRDEAEVSSLFHRAADVKLHRSRNGSLIMAHASPRAKPGRDTTAASMFHAK